MNLKFETIEHKIAVKLVYVAKPLSDQTDKVNEEWSHFSSLFISFERNQLALRQTLPCGPKLEFRQTLFHSPIIARTV